SGRKDDLHGSVGQSRTDTGPLAGRTSLFLGRSSRAAIGDRWRQQGRAIVRRAMTMLMGPVFRAELLRTARQRRYYVLRLVYGLVLLLLVWTGYEQMRWGQPVVSLADVAGFATTTFVSFAVVQLVTVLLLVPAVFGGAIADEKQRKTLH